MTGNIPFHLIFSSGMMRSELSEIAGDKGLYILYALFQLVDIVASSFQFVVFDAFALKNGLFSGSILCDIIPSS